MEKRGNDYIFHRIKRSLTWEKNKLHDLKSMGLKSTGSLFTSLEVEKAGQEGEDLSFSAFDWLNDHHDELLQKGFTFEQPEGQKRFIFGNSKIDLEFRENNDWFDLHAIVYFGFYQVPFVELKNHILNRIREFTLPTGEIAVIPEKWFS